MPKLWKIFIVVVIAAVVVGSGFYFWQNSTTSLPRTTIQQETSEEEKISKINTSGWEVYKNDILAVTIKYPKDENYSVEDYKMSEIQFGDKVIQTENIIITQAHPGNRIHIYRTKDKIVFDYLQQDGQFKEKTIGNILYKEFHNTGEGKGYGYMTERNSQYYIFESVWGPTNGIFELMMTTVQFE